MTKLRSLLRRGSDERGFTLIELLMVMVILTIIMATLTTLFVSGMKSELDMNHRFEAQEQVRTGVDKMRREIHCASSVALSVGDGSGRYAQVDVSVPKQCPTGNGVSTATVTYDVQPVAGSTSRFQLRRAGVVIADYLTSRYVFSYTAPSTLTLGKLHLDCPVNVNPNEGWKQWRLVTDIVLRNTQRKT